MTVEYLEYIQQSDSSGLEYFPSTPGNFNQDLLMIDVSVNNSNENISKLLESNDLSQTIVIENIINQAEIDEYNSVLMQVC